MFSGTDGLTAVVVDWSISSGVYASFCLLSYGALPYWVCLKFNGQDIKMFKH